MPITSLDELFISNDSDIQYQKEVLKISFDRSLQKWSFEYYAKAYHDPEFVRTYDADLGIEKLENFIRIIGW